MTKYKPSPLAALTPRQLEAACHIGRGMLYKEGAALMGVSFSTLRKHMDTCYQKLPVRNEVELTHLLLRYRAIRIKHAFSK